MLFFTHRHALIVCVLALALPTGRLLAACPCPAAVGPDQRYPTESTPYPTFVYDRLVTDSDMPEALQNHGRNSTLALDEHFGVVVVFESIDASGNGVYLTRFKQDGTRLCNHPSVIPAQCDDIFVRMDDSTTPGQHRHVSIAMRRLNPHSSNSCDEDSVFASWIATANGTDTLPELMQMTAPQSLLPNGMVSLVFTQT